MSSLGFWPGTPGGPLQEPAYYSYMVPEPVGFSKATFQPSGAYYLAELGNVILPYETVRGATDPERMILDFAQSTYETGANLAGWDRAQLER